MSQAIWRPVKRGTKYHSRPLRCAAGHMHQSTLESRRCDELMLLEQGGLIRDLEQQPRFRLDVNGLHIADYFGDWRYFDNERGCVVVEDAKGILTPECRLKLKLMAACHGINVELVRTSRGRSWR